MPLRVDQISDDRVQGRISKLNPAGYGFIITGDRTSYFFHVHECGGGFDLLQEGDAVNFLPARTVKGLRALDVRRDLL